MILKALFTSILCCFFLFCSAQKQLLTYQDVQYIMQNNPAQVASFLKQKNYEPQPVFGDEARYICLYADADYTSIVINTKGKHVAVQLLTTDIPQFETLEKAMQAYPAKNENGSKLYKIKENNLKEAIIKDDGESSNKNKIYEINFKN